MIPADLIVEKEETSTSTDVLSGTELDQPEGNGIILLWACSTVNTATLEVPMDGHGPGKTALLRKRTDGIPSIKEDPPFMIGVSKGVRPIIVLGGTTGTCHFTAAFYRQGKAKLAVLSQV